MAKPTIAIIGSLNVDLVTRTSRMPSAGETLNAHTFKIGFGGKGANQASACGRLTRSRHALSEGTVDVVMVGAVGDDQFASGMLDSLKDDGVEVSQVRTLKGESTGTATIIVEESSGQNRILITAGANGTFSEKDNLVPDAADVVLFQLEIPVETVLHNVSLAERKGIQVILNPAPAVPLPSAIYPSITHLIVNSTEALILSSSLDESASGHVKSLSDLDSMSQEQLDALVAPLLRAGAENVIVTLGSKGVYQQTLVGFSSRQPSKLLPAAKVSKVIDTTGAGDAFVGAYAVKVAEDVQERKVKDAQGGHHASKDRAIDVGKAVAWATKVAGRSVEHEGARGGVPWADELTS